MIDIHAGKRVLYKNEGQWEIGDIGVGAASVTDKGLFVPIVSRTSNNFYEKNINDLFLEAETFPEEIKDYQQYFMTKEQYADFVESEEFDRHRENSYVSDGEYTYYPVSKYTRNWIMKQPFEYIVRGD